MRDDYLREFFEKTAVAERTGKGLRRRITSSETSLMGKPYTTFCKILDGNQSDQKFMKITNDVN